MYESVMILHFLQYQVKPGEMLPKLTRFAQKIWDIVLIICSIRHLKNLIIWNDQTEELDSLGKDQFLVVLIIFQLPVCTD